MKSKNALKAIDILQNGGFEIEVDGKKTKFFLEPHVSLERFRALQKLQLEMAYATDFKTMYENLKEIYGLLNQTKFADSAVMIRDMIEGFHRIDDKNNYPAILRYAALILNTDEEDRNAYDEEAMTRKIKLWGEAGVPIQPFFTIVLHSVRGLMENYKEIGQNISKEEQE